MTLRILLVSLLRAGVSLETDLVVRRVWRDAEGGITSTRRFRWNE